MFCVIKWSKENRFILLVLLLGLSRPVLLCFLIFDFAYGAEGGEGAVGE